MHWKRVRLELARAEAFPKGSAGRAFLLDLPLDEAGMIDPAALAHSRTPALVRRFWACEPDQTGRVEWAGGSCLLRFGQTELGETVFRLQSAPLELNREIIVQDGDGAAIAFRVASIGGANLPPQQL